MSLSFQFFLFFPLSAIKENIPVEFPINLYLTVLREQHFFFLNKKNKKFRTEKKHVKCYEEILEILQQALKCRFLGSYFLYEGTSCSFSCSTKENI